MSDNTVKPNEWREPPTEENPHNADGNNGEERARKRPGDHPDSASTSIGGADTADGAPESDAQRFRVTVECAPVGIAHVRPDGSWLWVNDTLCSLLGYSRDELSARTFQAITYPGDLAADLTYVEEMLHGTRDTYAMDKRYIRKDGSLVWAHLTVSLIRDAAGRPDYFIGIVQDIGERKQHEAASAHLAAIVISSSDAIISKTLDGIITSWNASAERMFGYTAHEMIGQSILRLIPPERCAEEDTVLARLRAGEVVDHFETVRVTKDGRLIDVSLTISPIRDASGAIIGASKIARDITERKRLEEEQEHLLSIVGHEIGNPLTTLKAHIQLLQRRLTRAENDSTATTMVEASMPHLMAMERAVAQLERQALDLRMASRIEQNSLAIQPTRCDLASLCQQAVEAQRLVAEGRSIRIEKPATPVIVDADGDRVIQVITNLLTNALKYSPMDCPVTVSVRGFAGSATVAVRDEGPGIPANALPRLFSRFYRVPGVEAQSGGGPSLGLGLYIARSIVERHGGTLTVESTPGAGSTFRVTLPLATEGEREGEREDEREGERDELETSNQDDAL